MDTLLAQGIEIETLLNLIEKRISEVVAEAIKPLVENKLNEKISLKQAVSEFKYSDSSFRRKIKDGSLKNYGVGRDIVLLRNEINEMISNRNRI